MERNERDDAKVENDHDLEDDHGHRKKDKKEEQEEELSVERIFENQDVPSWRNQLTLRALVVSFVLSILFCVIVMKLNLTTGIIPSLNVSAGLLGFFFIKTLTKFLEKSGLLKQPFTRQENTVIQTCVVASSGIAFSGGFGSYLFGMSETVAKQLTEDSDAFKNPSLSWMIGFLFVVSFLGLFSAVPLREGHDYRLQIDISKWHCNCPSHQQLPHSCRSQASKVRHYETSCTYMDDHLTSSCGVSFNGSTLQEMVVDSLSSPHLVLKHMKTNFSFDFSATYVGVGMICPYIINISVLLGGILSWGLMWPLIDTKKGDWYPADLKPGSLHGLQGYKVFIATALILGDGLYNFFKVLSRTLAALFFQLRGRDATGDLPVADRSSPETSRISYDEQRRTHLFLKDQIPTWFAVAGYVTIAAISTTTVPHIFPELKWYYILVIYIFAPALAFCNAYGCGLTDWSLASTYGTLAIFVIGAWAGASHGGVLAGLAACGVMMNIVSTASDLSQDFKTGYLTLSSPRSMFAFKDLGTPGSQYPAPYATVFRNMAILGVEGFSSLPKNCLYLCYWFFGAAILINLIKDVLGKKRARFIPNPMAMAIPFYIGSYFAIDMCVGSLILFIWEKIDKAKADAFGPAVASGLILRGRDMDFA
ncbi:hypothetical protein H0E87_027626 [Populus deltoides]|uniref:Oligopeptide transporter n=1 Tax=Populus deltoides TaxID=3696 RepID=A0A8T2WQ35_POPDE|nr:hypothetical protein H0E87_027626 [Populus deltoides]